MFLIFEHLKFLLECPDPWGHFPGANAFEDFLDGLRCLFAVFELILDFVLLVAILGFLFDFFESLVECALVLSQVLGLA